MTEYLLHLAQVEPALHEHGSDATTAVIEFTERLGHHPNKVPVTMIPSKRSDPEARIYNRITDSLSGQTPKLLVPCFWVAYAGTRRVCETADESGVANRRTPKALA